MQEGHVKIRTKSGRMETFFAHPDGAGPYPGVILYMSIAGLTDGMRHSARRCAEAGYVACVPDLYYEFGHIILEGGGRNNPAIAPIRGAVRTIVDTPEKIMEDMGALLGWMDGYEFVKKGPKGVIGYCMGGPLAISTAVAFPDQVKATASLYGTALYSDDPKAAHHLVGGMRGEFYGGMAEHDIHMSAGAIQKFTEAMERDCTAKWTVETHPGSHHGYATPGGPVFNRQASEKSWERIFGMFERQL